MAHSWTCSCHRGWWTNSRRGDHWRIDRIVQFFIEWIFFLFQIWTVDCASLLSFQQFGPIPSWELVCIPSAVGTIWDGCFMGCRSLSTVTFESNSSLSCIGDCAFWKCSSLLSICLPFSVEKICQNYFNTYVSLLTITFESDSKLSSI
jgi:hypothetical protein